MLFNGSIGKSSWPYLRNTVRREEIRKDGQLSQELRILVLWLKMSSAVDAVAAIEAATTTRETLEVVPAKTHQSRFSIGNYHRHHYQVSLPIKTHCTTYSVREVTWWKLSRSVREIFTPYRLNFLGWGLVGPKRAILVAVIKYKVMHNVTFLFQLQAFLQATMVFTNLILW